MYTKSTHNISGSQKIANTCLSIPQLYYLGIVKSCEKDSKAVQVVVDLPHEQPHYLKFVMI